MTLHATAHGDCNIRAKIVAYSINENNGKRIVTFELDYPRYVHAEVMTHRSFSRNAASSRAIPIERMIELVKTTPAMPVWWGKNQTGMQAKEELTGKSLKRAQFWWRIGRHLAIFTAKMLFKAGLHKQIANRVLEPFQMMKTIVTMTEMENWFYLRDHPDAQPEIHELAECMRLALETSHPIPLHVGDWHMPYYGNSGYWTPTDNAYDLDEALRISASCCAQVSYRRNDDTLEKANAVYSRLVENKPVHASPTEHQATPMSPKTSPIHLEAGVTHFDIKGNPWSGNFKHWIQHRQLIVGHVKEDEV